MLLSEALSIVVLHWVRSFVKVRTAGKLYLAFADLKQLCMKKRIRSLNKVSSGNFSMWQLSRSTQLWAITSAHILKSLQTRWPKVIQTKPSISVSRALAINFTTARCTEYLRNDLRLRAHPKQNLVKVFSTILQHSAAWKVSDSSVICSIYSWKLSMRTSDGKS